MRKPFFTADDFKEIRPNGYEYHRNQEVAAQLANQKVQVLLEQIAALKAFINEMNEPFNWDE